MIPVLIGGRRYGAVLDPAGRRIAVTLLLASTAADLNDPGVHDAAVSRWERWLEGLGRRPEVAWVTISVESAPSPGTRLREAIQRRLSSMAPLDCRQLMDDLAATSPAVAAQTRTRATITFDLRAWDIHLGRAERRHGVAGYLPLLDHAVTGLVSGLEGCGVRVLGRASPEQLGAAVRVAYDPAAAGAIELALTTPGREIPGWAQAGPAAASEYRDRYVHDSGISVSFVWSQAPRQLVPSTVLDPLTRPGTHRKRLTCTYQPTLAGQAMDAATAQVRWRWLAAAISQLPIIGRARTAQDERDSAAALQATHEIAAGAGWIAQTVTVTTTVLDDADLPAAIADLQDAAGAAQLRLRRLYEGQAAAFAAGLPVGLSLTDLTARWTR